jgi:hypothetical protein
MQQSAVSSQQQAVSSKQEAGSRKQGAGSREQEAASSQQQAGSREQNKQFTAYRSPLAAHCSRLTAHDLPLTAYGLLLTIVLFLMLPATSWGQQIHTFTLTWSWEQGDGAAATGFILERRTLPAGSWLEVSRPPASARSIADTVVLGAQYAYRISAYNAIGQSVPSPEAIGDARVPNPVPELLLTAQQQLSQADQALVLATTQLGHVQCRTGRSQVLTATTAVRDARATVATAIALSH